MHVYMCACVYVCMCACVHVCMCACVHVRMCPCVHVCMCPCVHVCTCACVHVCIFKHREVHTALIITLIYFQLAVRKNTISTEIQQKNKNTLSILTLRKGSLDNYVTWVGLAAGVTPSV